jgi:hypothetical protein
VHKIAQRSCLQFHISRLALMNSSLCGVWYEMDAEKLSHLSDYSFCIHGMGDDLCTCKRRRCAQNSVDRESTAEMASFESQSTASPMKECT